MTSEERVKLALQHQEADRIPLDFGSTLLTGIHVNAYKNLLDYLGIEKQDFPIMYERAQNAIIHDDVLNRFKVDVRGVFSNEPPRIRSEDAHNDYYIDEWNVKYRKDKRDGKYFDIIEHALSAPELTKEDIDAHSWPNLATPERFAGLKQRAQELKANTGCALVMEGVMGIAIMDGSFFVRGFENLYMDLASNPSAAGYLMDKKLELQLQYWEKALQELGDELLIVRLGDDLGEQTKTRVSPRMYRKLIKPRHEKLIASIKKMAKGELYIFLHSDGAIYKLIPDLIEVGVDILNPIQYTATDMEPKKLKQEFGNDLTFWGGTIDPQGILSTGTPQQIKDEVTRHMDDLAPGGGFVFSPIHNFQDDVPPQNIMAVFEALEENGQY